MAAVLESKVMKQESMSQRIPEPELLGKHVLVVGMGISGQAVVDLLLSKEAYIYAYDQNEKQIDTLQTRWSSQSVELITDDFVPDEIDLCVLSPGVPPDSPMAASCKENGVPITGEFELASRFITRPCIAVTGTNGKTTVVNMIHHILTECGYDSDLAGNVGSPVSDLILQKKCDGDAPVVMEVSSYQCETIAHFHPAVAVITNLAPDHLERYDSVKDYYAAKFELLRNQNANEVLWTTPGVEGQLPGWVQSVVHLAALSDDTVEGLYCVEGNYVLRDGGNESQHPYSSFSVLPQQQMNALCAMGACVSISVPLAHAADALNTFVPLPHRLEFIGDVKGVRCFNDSKATNIHAMQAALQSVDAPVRLLAGGRGKGESLEPVASLIKDKVTAAYLIGESAELFESAWKNMTTIYRKDSLEDAVQHALRDAKEGETLLLSPGCASWDMFQNYAERGDRFRQCVKEYSA